MKFSFLLYSVTLIRLFPSINRLISSLNSIQINLKSSADIFDEVETNLIEKKNFQLKKLDTLKKISLNNINYKINDLRLFNNFNLILPKGTLTAITGPSGSGKTTLSEIILGFKKIENGKIYLNDMDLEEVDINTYYEQIGYVGQEIVLMQDSLYNNLIFGRNIHINNDEIMKILKRLDLKRFINFDVKNLMINEESLNISGGEKQRLGIARALINKPKLLILDEITSSLDNKNAIKIMELLNLIKKDCIILCISHDRTLIPYFDNIVEL